MKVEALLPSYQPAGRKVRGPSVSEAYRTLPTSSAGRKVRESSQLMEKVRGLQPRSSASPSTVKVEALLPSSQLGWEEGKRVHHS